MCIYRFTSVHTIFVYVFSWYFVEILLSFSHVRIAIFLFKYICAGLMEAINNIYTTINCTMTVSLVGDSKIYLPRPTVNTQSNKDFKKKCAIKFELKRVKHVWKKQCFITHTRQIKKRIVLHRRSKNCTSCLWLRLRNALRLSQLEMFSIFHLKCRPLFIGDMKYFYPKFIFFHYFFNEELAFFRIFPMWFDFKS